jgi:adenylate kinase family enzyme
VPRDELAARVAEVVAGPSWVIDGNYSAIRRCHLDAPDLFVWLDFPLHVTFARLLKRSLVRSWTAEPCCNGNRESFRRTFLHRESILLWALTSHRRRMRNLLEDLAPRPHVRLRGQRAVDRWLATGGAWGRGRRGGPRPAG